MKPGPSARSSEILRIGMFGAITALLIAYTIVTYRYAGLMLVIALASYLATKVGYRAIDFLLFFIPIYSWIHLFKIVWRACALPFPALQAERDSWMPQVIQQVIPMSAPPNWYADPSGQASFRFFDGYQWTHFATIGPAPPSDFPMHAAQYVQEIEQRGPQDGTDESSVICPVCHKLQVFKHKHAQTTSTL